MKQAEMGVCVYTLFLKVLLSFSGWPLSLSVSLTPFDSCTVPFATVVKVRVLA